MITIVSGPGFSGKSRFIDEGGWGIPEPEKHPNIEYLQAFHSKARQPYDGMILHYNINRVKGVDGDTLRFLSSLKAVAANGDVRAIVMVCPETELMERIFLHGGRSGRASKRLGEARALFSAPGNIKAIYHNWLATLAKAGIQPVIIESSRGAFREIHASGLERALARPSTTTATTYSPSEIERKLKEGAIDRYHRVELPYGYYAHGQEVWDRFAFALPTDLTGKTVLDIGCAHGAFAFEAERRGATVVACDTNAMRLQSARMLADLLGSTVHFTSRDYFDDRTDRSFDLVLALNVLHHVADPEGALRAMAELATRWVVLEFPTSRDPLYQDKKMRRLVGPELIENIELFDLVKLCRSPKAGRLFAICTKGAAMREGAWGVGSVGLMARRGAPTHERQIGRTPAVRGLHSRRFARVRKLFGQR